jgi:Protein of unknown function (DUF2970)
MNEGKKGGALRAALAVFWSFFGVRRQSHYESDAMQLKPAQVIIAGLIGAALFVLAILGLVLWITR